MGERRLRPLPLAGVGAGPERRPLLQPPWEPPTWAAGPEFGTAGGWAATPSAAGMRWRPLSHFPEESPKGRSGAWLGRRLPGPASEGTARLLPSAAPSRSEKSPTLVRRRGQRIQDSLRVHGPPQPHLVVPQISATTDSFTCSLQLLKSWAHPPSLIKTPRLRSHQAPRLCLAHSTGWRLCDQGK